MSSPNALSLPVPGARLYYEVHGNGPMLLMIAAGAGDADSYDTLLRFLVRDYTVVTYDRRGYARSPLGDPGQRIEIGTHADDAHALLTEIGGERAYVFGGSIGALIGLELVRRHPEQVRMLVAHEPPLGQLLPKAERADSNLADMYRQEGAAKALQHFAERIGVRHAGSTSNAGLDQRSAEAAQENREAFFSHDVGAVARYQLDIDALQRGSARVVLAGSSQGREYYPYRCALALAERLGTELVEFPGTHAGFVDYPEQFAAKLKHVLGN